MGSGLTDRSRFYARLGAATQCIFAVLISISAMLSSVPEFVPRGVVIGGAYTLPGVVALVGVAGRRPGLVVAAAMTSALGSVFAFSGVTLIFLIPALLLTAGAVGLVRTGTPAKEKWLPSAVSQLAIAAVLVVLMVGAGAAALLDTDAGCWIVHGTPTGNRIEPLPYSTGGMELSGDARSGGCSTGLISPRGVGLGGLLAGTAIALAVVSARRRATAID